MGKNLDTYNLLADMFTNSFLTAAVETDEEFRPHVVRNIRQFFNKWFYSSLIDGYLLSPANLLLAGYTSGGGEGALYPNFILDNEKGLVFSFDEYSLSRHPFVNDIKFLVEQFDERRDLINEPYFSEPGFLNNLSVPDAEYAWILGLIAVRLGALKRLPAINAEVLQKTEDCDKILTCSVKQLLSNAAYALADECAERLHKAFPAAEMLEEKLARFLKHSLSVVDELYEMLGGLEANIGDFVDFENNTINAAELFNDIAEVSAKSVYAETTLDRFFFTPLACYLKLIQPVYTDRLRMRPLFQEYGNRIKAEVPTDGLNFYLFWGYSFTPLGLDVLDAEKLGEEFEDVLLPADISPAPIFQALSGAFYPDFARSYGVPFNVKEALPPKLLSSMTKNKNRVVYGFNVACRQLMDEEVYIEVEESFTLDMLHEYICGFIGFHPDFEYTIYAGETNSPFTTYTLDAPFESRNTDVVTFANLPLEPGTVLRYVLHGMTGNPWAEESEFFGKEQDEEDHGITFELVTAKKTRARYGKVYPWQKIVQ